MANTNAPFGLRPVRHRNGAPYSGAARKMFIPSSDANNIFIGDPVLITNAGDSTTGVPTCTIATAGASNYISGVIQAVIPTTRDSTIYRAASTGTYVLVCDDPDVIFEIQGTANIASTAVGNNANLSAGGGGSTVTGMSSWQLDTTSVNTTNTLQLRIIELVARTDNDIASNYDKALVAINLHSTRNLTGI